MILSFDASRYGRSVLKLSERKLLMRPNGRVMLMQSSSVMMRKHDMWVWYGRSEKRKIEGEKQL